MKTMKLTLDRSQLETYMSLRENAEIIEIDGTAYHVESITYIAESRFFFTNLKEVRFIKSKANSDKALANKSVLGGTEMDITAGVIETMNVRDLSVKLRALGMKVSESTLSQGIEQGVYPFGHCIKTTTDGRRFEVFTRLVDEWIAERLVPADAQSGTGE